MEKTKFTVADDKNYTLASPQENKFNEWVSNLQWAFRKIKQDVYNESGEFIDYLVVSYEVLPVLTAIYKVESPQPLKDSTWLAGRFLPEDNNYYIELWTSLDLEPNTIGFGVADRIDKSEDADDRSRLDRLSTGVVSVIHIA